MRWESLVFITFILLIPKFESLSLLKTFFLTFYTYYYLNVYHTLKIIITVMTRLGNIGQAHAAVSHNHWDMLH